MLIDKKFIYINIPRCASTSFHIGCIRAGIDIEYVGIDIEYDTQLEKLTNMEIAYKIPHMHQNIYDILSFFGDSYEIISVKRNKYERFVSYFNHCIGELKKMREDIMYEKFKKIQLEDLMFFKKDDVSDKNAIKKLTKRFLNNIEIFDYSEKIEHLIMPMFAHPSYYHKNNTKIKWFDFNNLIELENWVSDKCKKDFKLEIFGSSREYESQIIVNEQFISKYEEIYYSYENFKKQKSLI